MSWKPQPRAGVDVKTLPLSPLQGYLISRLDGASDVGAIAAVTGMPAERVETLLNELVALGAVEASAEAQPAAPAAAEAPADQPASEPAPEPEPPHEENEPSPEENAVDQGTHRKLFETVLHHQTADERTALARHAVEPALSALCFDPLPAVIVALLENPQAGLAQARLIARHHRTPQGLEAIASRGAFAADLGVRRGLLANPQLPAGLFRRLWQARRLLEQYQITISREVPEQTKRTAREVMRSHFATGPAEERVELIMKTEGRCLNQLIGLAVDSKTTSLLCARTFASTILIQNIARWSAAPPTLIAHLLRQEMVKRNPQLRLMLERHPNAP